MKIWEQPLDVFSDAPRHDVPHFVKATPGFAANRQHTHSAERHRQGTQQKWTGRTTLDAVRATVEEFNARADILDVIGGDAKRTCSSNGGEWHAPCPACGGDDRLVIWPDHPSGIPTAWCRQCERRGDACRWAMTVAGFDPETRGDTARFLRLEGLLESNSPRREFAGSPRTTAPPMHRALSNSVVAADGERSGSGIPGLAWRCKPLPDPLPRDWPRNVDGSPCREVDVPPARQTNVSCPF